MRCLYCDEEINEYSIYSLLFEEDYLCQKCRKSLKYHYQKIMIEDMEVEIFYDYDSLFKDVLLQYKECYDEVLKKVFLYKIKDYLMIKYHNYNIMYVPSSIKKREERGFNHLKEIFEELKLKEIEGIQMKEDISQLSKGYKDRLKMENNFIYKGNIHPNNLLIVDDVYTTGSSIKGVYKAMKPYCKKIKAVVLAKT